jgi:2-keto-3-deoxy-L-rhamnonate aldolase RhmA
LILELEKARKLKAKLRAGEPCIGAQIGLSDPAIAEIFGAAGYDWFDIDTEHSANNTVTVQAMLQAAAHTKAAVLARPLRLDPDEIRRFLDLGAQGILCPFVNTGEEARQLVQACRYPPAGIRGYGPRRAGVYGLSSDEYFHQANEALLCIPIIESREAVQNIEAIVSVDGIDAVCIGPVDFSISLGIYKRFDDPIYWAAAEQVRQACRKHRKAMGTGCPSLEHAQRCLTAGDVFLMAGGDEGFLMSESRRWLETLQKGEQP